MAPDTPPTLLTIPPELRAQIYFHLLTDPADAFTTAHRASPSPRPAWPFHPAILLANSLLNAEATPHLYTPHTFIAHPSLLTSLPAHPLAPDRPVIPRRRRHRRTAEKQPYPLCLITRFRLPVRLDVDPAFSTGDLKRAFDGVAYLELDVSEAMFRGAGWGVLELFGGVGRVGRCVVRGSVGGEVAAWVEGCVTGRGGEGGVGLGAWLGEKERGGQRVGDVWTFGNR